jgi:flagellum-specific peptidoglycan hydrolase FlgJ
MNKILLTIAILVTHSINAQTVHEVKQFMEDSTDIKYPTIVLTQSILETGWFKSYNSKERHNLFGFWDSRKQTYFVYSNWKESIRSYERWQKKWYTGGEYYDFLECIYKGSDGDCKRYASDPNYISKLKTINI